MEPMNHNALDDTKQLYDASIDGNIDTLNRLIKKDSLVLTRITPTFFKETPLHIAALNGHTNYAKELLLHRPPLAGEVDAWGHTALHLASAKGYVETVKALVQADCSVCLKQNSEGRLPLHLAILKRHVEVVRELVRAHPQAAREVLDDGGQNAAHLCVKANYLEGLKAILKELHLHGGDVHELLAAKDQDGNTILHLAAAVKSFKIVEYIEPLIGREIAHATNNNEKTALDISECSILRDVEDLRVTNFLINAGIPSGTPRARITYSRHQNISNKRGRIHLLIDKIAPSLLHYNDKWIETMTQSLIIVAVLVSTVAFQAGLQPPGGVYPNQQPDPHDAKKVYPAGSAVVARDVDFFTFNTLAFLSSLSVILLLVSGAPLRHRYCVWFLVLLVWATLTFMTLTYSAAMRVVDASPLYNTPNGLQKEFKSGFGRYLYLPHTAYGATMTTWFVTLGGVILFQLIVVVVAVLHPIYRHLPDHLRRLSSSVRTRTTT